MKNYYPSIQVLRGVLFLFILAFHCGVPYASFGWCGVESFFVVSAFFLVRKYWGSETISVKEQFRHRITRLYPPYIAVLIVAALYALLVKVIPYDLVTHLFSAQNFHWMITGYKSSIQPMTAHTWTLSIEVWAGLLWLLLLKWMPKEYFKRIMYGFLLVGIIYRVTAIICGADVWVVSLCPLAHFDAFACGSLLAIAIKVKKVDTKVWFISIIGGVVGIVACIGYLSSVNAVSVVDAYRLLSSSKNYLNNWFTGNIYLFISLITTGIVGLLYIHDEKRIGEERQINKIFVALGNNSYILYLFHWPILAVMKRIVGHWGVQFSASLALSIFTALIFNRLYANLHKKLSGGK